MKKVKRLTAVLMIGAMTLALVACGGKQEAVSTTAAPAPTQAESAKEETKAEGKETQAEAAPESSFLYSLRSILPFCHSYSVP